MIFYVDCCSSLLQRASVLLLCVTIGSMQISAQENTGPFNQAVISGNNATLRSSSDSCIFWYFDNGYKNVLIAYFNRVISKYANKYSARAEPNNTSALTIRNAQPSDAGIYYCQEDFADSDYESSQPSTSSVLIVVDKPNCTVSYLEPLKADNRVTLTCSATYRPAGLIEMHATWFNPSGQAIQPFSTPQQQFGQTDLFVSSIQLVAKPPAVLPHSVSLWFGAFLNNNTITFTATNRPVLGFTWKSPLINVTGDTRTVCPSRIQILPSSQPVLFVGDFITCFVSDFPGARYRWLNRETDQRGEGLTLRLTSTGQMTYTCNATVNVTVNGRQCSPLSTFVSINVTIASSCAKIKQVKPNAPSGRYTITTIAGRNIEVYCEMGLNGGGYTFLYSGSLTDLTDPEVQALFADRTNVLMRTQRNGCDGWQHFAVLSQLPQFSNVDISIGLSTAPQGYSPLGVNSRPNYLGPLYLFFGFIPEILRQPNTMQGLLVNNVSVSYTATQSNNSIHHIILIPGFNELAYIDLATGSYQFITEFFNNTKPNPSGRRLPLECFMFLEIYWANAPALGNTYGDQFEDLCVQTVAMGIR